MYAQGNGVTKDDAAAAVWYRRAAEQGNAMAQFNLGNLHARGQGVPQDDVQAVSWYRKSAEQGDGKARNALGLMYLRGKGVVKDDVRAYTGSVPAQPRVEYRRRNQSQPNVRPGERRAKEPDCCLCSA